MLLDSIQAELVRVQIHPVNLDVLTQDGQLVVLGGSLLRYWTVPRSSTPSRCSMCCGYPMRPVHRRHDRHLRDIYEHDAIGPR